jgi:hypothetical protein
MISRRALFKQHTRFMGMPANSSITVLPSNTDPVIPTAIRGVAPANDGRRWPVGEAPWLSRAIGGALGHTRRDMAGR